MGAWAVDRVGGASGFEMGSCAVDRMSEGSGRGLVKTTKNKNKIYETGIQNRVKIPKKEDRSNKEVWVCRWKSEVGGKVRVEKRR